MRFFVLAIAVCSLGSGCSMLHSGCQTLVVEPVKYCFHKDDHRTKVQSRRLAAATWTRIERASPPRTYSPDYELGFMDGFTDYIFAGGTGNPPPVPPRQYWKLRYQTPAGHLAVQDWYAGFRHGSMEAMAGGYREFVTVPPSVAGLSPPNASTLTTATNPVPEQLPSTAIPRAVTPERLPPPGN